MQDIIVEISDEDRLAGHIPDEYYKLARNNNVFYEDKKLGKLVQILDLTEGDEEPAASLSIKTQDTHCIKPQDTLNNGEALQLVCRCNERLREEEQELLKAVKQALEIFEGEWPIDDEVMGPVMIEYKALITKIEGE